MKRADYLIVGQGIVGSVVAMSLLQRGRSLVVIDQLQLSSSSRVAAGAYNPFNFRRMINNWKAAEMVRSAGQFYTAAGETLRQKFFFPRNVLKIFSNENERQLWERSCAENEGLFADPRILENPFPGAVHAPFGIGVVNHAGNIDPAVFFYLLTEYLRNRQAFLEEKFEHELLQLTENGVEYDNRISAGQVIFCEGHLARKNPWFGDLPLVPVKGQVLHVYIPGLQLTDILNRGAYLLPLGGERFILGSTFENGRDDEMSTENARANLLEKLQKFVALPARVESQFAGVRPAVKDRRPILGRHPQHPQLAIINGMGSKAVFLSPWLTERLIDHLENGTELPAEVRLDRFTRS